MRHTPYPFTALVGQDSLKTALLLNAVDPGIGGVLIRGTKGTGKSTAVRALADVLPTLRVVTDCPYRCDPDRPEDMCHACRTAAETGVLPATERPTPLIELPLNASEDRLVGALHIERALRDGTREFEPGLLAAANRGILYVDEVNLLEDHLVDLLLDAAASGHCRVEREGLSRIYPARFVLVGTMNPEEGELRPQFLDRFGLCVAADDLRDPGDRREIVLRRLAYEVDPSGFCRRWEAENAVLRGLVAAARDRLRSVTVPDSCVEAAVALALQVSAAGHRADIALLRTARALAAFVERPQVEPGDVREAARLALPHRVRTDGIDSPEHGLERVHDLLTNGRKAPGDRLTAAVDDREDAFVTDEGVVPGSFAAGGLLFAYVKKKLDSSRLTNGPASAASTSMSCA